MDKLFIKSEDLLKDSFQLAWNVYKSGYAPNYIIGVWRGGAKMKAKMRSRDVTEGLAVADDEVLDAEGRLGDLSFTQSHRQVAQTW